MIALLDKPTVQTQRDTVGADPVPRQTVAEHFFCGMPLRPGTAAAMKRESESGTMGFMRPSEQTFSLEPVETSDYCRNFNEVWRRAYNARHKITRFVLKHDDIECKTKFYADVLQREMDRVGADVISAVIAIKDPRGVTSTGYRDPSTNANCLLTVKQVLEDLPQTFSIEDLQDRDLKIGEDDTLQINTGLMMVRWDHPKVKRFPGFNTVHKMALDSEGKMQRQELTEDWNFSEWARRAGMRVFATTIIQIDHSDGIAADPESGKFLLNHEGQPFIDMYPNYVVWGESVGITHREALGVKLQGQ